MHPKVRIFDIRLHTDASRLAGKGRSVHRTTVLWFAGFCASPEVATSIAEGAVAGSGAVPDEIKVPSGRIRRSWRVLGGNNVESARQGQLFLATKQSPPLACSLAHKLCASALEMPLDRTR